MSRKSKATKHPKPTERQGSLFGEDTLEDTGAEEQLLETDEDDLEDRYVMEAIPAEDDLPLEEDQSAQEWAEALSMPPEETHRQRLIELREQHRLLSDKIISTNRGIARIASKEQSLDSPKARRLLDRLAALRKEKAAIEATAQETLAVLKQLERRRGGNVSPESLKGGLVKVRHQNRDFFLADLFDYAMKDDGVSMEAPIFTLSTKPDLSIWEWRSQDGSKYVKVAPSVLGRATQHDKDILIYVVSQLVEGLNRGREDARSRVVRFTVYDFLVTTNRDTSGTGYRRLHEAFERLAGTRITTDIKTGNTRIKEGFGIIDRWKIIEKSPTDERMIAVEVTLSEWLYNAVQALEVLTIHPDYFRLRKPLARRLYELARKHCGHQPQWTISLELLHKKTGSKSTLREFRRAVRAIQKDNSLPEYRFVLHDNERVTFYSRNQRKLLRGAIRPIRKNG